ncbi:DNA-3-methyladenine glycosylase I [Ornithinimicrobium pratense]|uniref:DNA-3-methyladenine glycosylase I n=1 Tax=Ornithinimicrobium pratense TaxID=2593973 RepID=A0A5J6V7V5_9MICO|nr:DNA-3-methyladenine glycosylase I [Ornithinimicrobium pratense]QFG69196.1 DNA-3-methyladenine glycosylase I [Ornithinimicrobium pratense]
MSITPAHPDLTVGPDGVVRCAWPGLAHADYRDYHDREWGKPVHGEAPLLERLCLEGFQSGLSWLVILRKRPAFRRAFHHFDADRIAGFTEADVERLLEDEQIVRNRRKIEATIQNARATLALREQGGLEELLWTHAPEPTPRPRTFAEVPSQTLESELLAKRLRKVGFAQVGPTTVYAAMQACGLVDDHLAGCFRAGASRSGSRVTGLHATS